MPIGDDFDPERWAATADAQPAATPTPRQRRRRSRRPDRFLKGPVPWPWLLSAMVLPGKALAVGLMLWLQSGITGNRTLTFCLSRAAGDGIPMTTARRAMKALERAGLVSIRRMPGRGLEVTILEQSAQP
jgi:hypothetical protein